MKNGENYLIELEVVENEPATLYGFYGTNPLNLRTGDNVLEKIQRLESQLGVAKEALIKISEYNPEGIGELSGKALKEIEELKGDKNEQ